MAELEQQPRPAAPFHDPPPSDADPIRSLHRMSTTAGATNQEYVAINNLAVLAALFGLASVLAVVFAAPFLLILGVAGIIFGAVAVYQIRDSNGTQGGLAIALAGILFSLGVAGAYAYQAYRAAQIHKQQVAQINAVIDRIGRHLIAGEYEQAYAIFDPSFQSQWPRDEFVAQWKQLIPLTGRLKSMRGNNVVLFESTREGDTADTQAIMDFEKISGSRQTFRFRQTPDGQWSPVFFGLFDRRQR